MIALAIRLLTGPTAVGLACLALLIGCATPHENFARNIRSHIGDKWTELGPAFPPESDLINSRVLPNGNIEKTYRSTWRFGWDRSVERICIQIFEIDPKTDVILSADFRGERNTEEDCVSPPG